MRVFMRTTTNTGRAWRMIRRLLVVAAVFVVVRPGSAGLMSVRALAVEEIPAVRQLVQSILRLAGRQQPEGGNLRGDLEAALGQAEAAAATGDSIEEEIARESPFKQIRGDAFDRQEARAGGEAKERLYLSPSNAPLARAARALRTTL